jgi:hypothetical protein
MENVVLLCPGKAFVDMLPGRKIPSREDFREYWHRDTERITFWDKVVKSSTVLGEEFLEAVHKGTIVNHLRPIAGVFSSGGR